MARLLQRAANVASGKVSRPSSGSLMVTPPVELPWIAHTDCDSLGQFLAVGWSDGVVRLMGLETNKAVHQVPVCEAGKAKITCIGWSRNCVGRRPGAAKSSSILTWEHLASKGIDASDKNFVSDLPRELTFLEVETSLPKISPLPASGGSG
jgi:anaphase-promoting complex subunit 4